MPTKKYNAPIPFRASKIILERLDELSELWQINRSQVIIQCITLTWARFANSANNSNNSEKQIINSPM